MSGNEAADAIAGDASVLGFLVSGILSFELKLLSFDTS
jgi:hypothetical protein